MVEAVADIVGVSIWMGGCRLIEIAGPLA